MIPTIDYYDKNATEYSESTNGVESKLYRILFYFKIS